MRPIDADALDSAFTDLRFNADGTLAHWGDRPDWCLHGSEVEKLIENAPTIDGWINANERLPDNEQDVLAYLDDGEETRIAPCNYFKGVWFDCTMNCIVAIQHVTHWMPIPEPPKEEMQK